MVHIPLYARACCAALHQAGFEAYPVGGCVRDLLLGRTPQDWDVCTSALPQQVQALFPHTVATGLAYGTVTVVLEGGTVEVTTFRQEAPYRDGRRPEGVRYVSSLECDLSRRDFTVNAMALTLEGQVIDPFGGEGDLEARLLRCVGDPQLRFTEDRLRMFRALRFAAQLQFHLEPATAAALERLGGQPYTLPPERIRPEMEQTLCAPAPRWASMFFSSGLLCALLPGRVEVDTSPLAQLSPLPLARWAGLGALLTHADVDPLPLFTALLPHKKLCAPLTKALALARQPYPTQPRPWRHLLAQFGPDTCQALAAMAQVQGDAVPAAVLAQVLDQAPCLSVRELAVSGRDLQALGLSGPDIGRMQRLLLDHVLDHPQHNTPDFLLPLAAQKKIPPA